MDLDYRSSLDSIGPLIVTPRGAIYVLVVVEHFRKWIELVALPKNSLELAVITFLDYSLAHFGAQVEVLTNQEKKSLGSF